MTSLFNIGVGGLRTNQGVLGVIGQNITNASTPGYARQRANVASQVGASSLGVRQGAGARVDSITRVANRFVDTQVVLDTASFNQFDALSSRIGQLEGVIFSEDFGIDGQLQKFFAAVQNASATPVDTAARQFVLSEGRALGARFAAAGERLALQGEEVESALQSASSQINQIATALGSLNGRITQVLDDQTSVAKNVLLDSRQVLLQDLAALVEIDALEQPDGSISVFIGKGQALVLGENVAEVEISRGGGEVTLQPAGTRSKQVITNSITDGEIGGLLRFREEVLKPASNDLGRLAMNISAQFNAQHALGVDLKGTFGGDFFTLLNDSALLGRRVTYLTPNSGNSGEVQVLIDDINDTIPSDYELRFSNTLPDAYTVVRLSDNELVAGGSLSGPSTQIEFDGLEINIDGGNFPAGTRMLLEPFANFIDQMDVIITDTDRLALAAPVALSQAPGNSGDAQFELAEIFDSTHPVFMESGELVPPLLVEFVSDSRYQLLDNSDPVNPQPLQPDLGLFTFIPGQVNQLLPNQAGTMVTSSDGPLAGALAGAPVRVNNLLPGANQNSGGDITFSFGLDSEFAGTAPRKVTLDAGMSARESAQLLSTAPGVSASARTTAVLSDLQVVGGGVPLEFAINGEVISGFSDLAGLADLISANTELKEAGIVAKSDGVTLELTSVYGDDLNLHFQGDPNEGLTVQDNRGGAAVLQGSVNNEFSRVTLFGEITTILDPDVGMTTDADGLFAGVPDLQRADYGIDLTLTGSITQGDKFQVGFNQGGGADNRNAVALANLAQRVFPGQPPQTFAQTYSTMVQDIGSAAAQARIRAEAAQTVLQQSQSLRESISGVNLDEEAADLLRYEQAYNASAQIITVARDVLATLLNAFG